MKWLLLSTLALAACGEKEPLVLTPPASLLRCADEPAPPSLPERDGTDERQLERDRVMLQGYLDLRSAFGDCKSKVQGVATWVDGVSH